MASPQMMDSGRAIPPAVVKTSRLIWAAMLIGQLVFVAVIVLLPPHEVVRQNNRLPILPLTAVDGVVLFVGISATVVAPRLLLNLDADDRTLRAKYVAAMLIPMGFLEGASFTGLVFAFVTGQWWPLGVVPAISLLVQLTLFPRSVVKRRE